MRTHLAAVLILTVASATYVSAQGVRFKSYYEGLPDLDEKPPFAALTPGQTRSLREFVLRQSGSDAACGRAAAVVGVREVCDRGADEGKVLLRSLARGLPPGQFARLWRTHIDDSDDAELLVQYDAAIGDPSDRYSAFLVFRWSQAGFHVTAASWFLEGSVHAVKPFGSAATGKLFLRFVSCTACEPWVYLIICDMLAAPSGAAFQFQYSVDDPEGWQTEVEYELPGMGHSIDASVETRVLGAPQPGEPSLLQYFDVKGGEDEWWAFTCKGHKCTGQVFTGKAPEQFLARWRRAKRL